MQAEATYLTSAWILGVQGIVTQLGESAHLVCAKPSIQSPAWEEKGGEAFEGERQQSTGEAARCWGGISVCGSGFRSMPQVQGVCRVYACVIMSSGRDLNTKK